MENTLTNKEQEELNEAYRFSMGLRGRYIIAEALYHAINLMERVPAEYRESSDIADMKYLQRTLYGSFPVTLFHDASTNMWHEGLTDGDCIHVVEDCEIENSCQCGAVLT